MRPRPLSSTPGLSRRSALGHGAALGAVLGLGRFGRAAAQDATPGAATLAAPGQTAAINGAGLYYEVRGDAAGEPVLLLHGGLGNTEEWDNVSPALVDAGYQVVLMDCRGRGRSTWGDAPITYEQMASDALGLLDHLGIDTTHLVGWSDRGIIGLELAINHPARLDRAVIYGANFTPDGAYAEPQPSDQLPPFEVFVSAYQRLSPEPELSLIHI